MNTIPRFDTAQANALRAFLDSGERSPESMGYSEATGFLFVVVCAPELVQPSEWLPIIIDPDNTPETNVANMQAVMGGLMSLYNELTRQVQQDDVKLLPGCAFHKESMDNLETDATMSQWARGFMFGYKWLEKMWTDYTPADIREEFGYQMTVLCFFSSREIATAFFDEVKNKDVTLESMATNMQRIFPDAMQSFALLGNSIQQVIAKRGQEPQQPIVRGEKVGRNEPCTCGSGKKYKKCCGATLH